MLYKPSIGGNLKISLSKTLKNLQEDLWKVDILTSKYLSLPILHSNIINVVRNFV